MSNVHIQRANAERVMRLVREKLAAKGFTFGEGAFSDSVYPPEGMGHFAATEHTETALREASEEVARSPFSIVPKED